MAQLVANTTESVPSADAKAPASRKRPITAKAKLNDVPQILGPKVHVPTSTMTTVLRHVSTQVSLRGFRKLLEGCPAATCPLQNDAQRDFVMSCHALMCCYNLQIRLELETARVWGQSSLVAYKSYVPVCKVVASAIEAFSSWKAPNGYYVYVDLATAVAQLEKLKTKYWAKAFPGVATIPSEYGQAASTSFAKAQGEILRGLGRDWSRIPGESTDFSILHCGVYRHGKDAYSVVGHACLTHLSELIARVLMLREYQQEGIGFSYVPRDATDYDSVHFTAGFSSGRSWSFADALFQLRSSVSLGQNRVA